VKNRVIAANKMFKIMLSMLRKSWKNEDIMGAAIEDFISLLNKINLSTEELDEAIRISDRLSFLEKVTWDEFLEEYKLQSGEEINIETSND